MSTWVGLDISMKSIDIAYCKGDEKIHFKIDNNINGFRKLLKESPRGSKFVMEATGLYFIECAKFLVDKKKFVCVENPLKIKRFAQMDLIRTKNDKLDAYVIAKYGEMIQPKEWKQPSSNQLKCQQLQGAIDLIVKTITSIKNQIHAYVSSGFSDKMIVQALTKNIKDLEKTRTSFEVKLVKLVEKEFPNELKLISSIPGVGAITSCMILTKVGDLKSFESSRQLVSYFGLTPLESYSGTSIKSKGRISKMGNPRIRSQLYMCAVSSIRHNSHVRSMYLRMVKAGKHKKKIVVAAMCKLVRQIFGVLKSGKPFDPVFS